MAELYTDVNKITANLQLKAEKDLSNVGEVAQTFKEASIGWGMPDYSAIIDITSMETYTFPTDGIFFMYSANGHLAYGSNKFNSGFLEYTYSCFGNQNTATAVEYRVEKGEIITRKYASGSYKAFFFPLKGVN